MLERPIVSTNPRTQPSFAPVPGVQPMNWLRLVASVNTVFTALSIAVWYCSTPRSAVTTLAAPITAKLPL